MPIIGCHLSDREGFLAMATETVGLGAQTFQFFTRNPRGGAAKTWELGDEEAYLTYAGEHKLAPFVAYAAYTVNPASAIQSESDFARLVLSEDLSRLDAFPSSYYAFRPGSVGEQESEEAGVARLVTALDEVLQPTHKAFVLVIPSAGSGHEICSHLEEVQKVLAEVKLHEQVGVLLDTTTLWGAGYDIKDHLDDVIGQVDSVIGLDKVKAVHLADPKYDLATHHTNHMTLGEGKLGLEGLAQVFHHEALADKLFILETPHDDMKAYAKAIEFLTR